LLFQENTGALGYIGANRLAFAYNMNDLWEEFWRTYYDDGISTIGKTLDVTRSKYFLLNVENSYMYEYRYLPMAFNLLGDPSLKIGNIQENGPIIKSIPSMIFSSGQNYQYDYDNQAVAIGEGNITWTKVSGPEFFNIQQDGLVDWIPNVGSEKNNYGRPTIIIKASDENGSTNQKFTSAMINNYFVIDSKPNIIATLNKEYFYNENKKATNSFQKWPYSLDPAPKWKLMKGPKGFSIDNNTGEIKWLPTQLGEFEVIIYSYYKSWINSQQFFIKVNPIDQDSIKANFFAEKYNGVVPFEVKFHERSLGKVSKWKWDFGDGMTSSESNPIHTYLKGDTLSVKLIVYGESSKDSIVRNNYIVALPEPPPIANFTATNRIAKNYSEVQFTNLTSNTSNKWTWNFGDGTTSTEKNPIHKYSSPGSYDVKLFSKGPYGENEKIKYHYINIYDSLKDTIISVWEFNDKTDVLTDSKNGINGKVNGASWNKECDKSNLHFDGIDDYVLIGDNENFNPDFITIEAMVKIDSYKKATIIDRWGDWGQFSIGLGDFNGNEIDHLFFSILPDPNILAGIHSVRCEKTIPLNQWIHIAGVFDGDSMKVYMDYKKMGAFEFSGKLGSHSSDLFIGCGFFGAYTVRPIDMRFFNGDIAEVRISRYPLQPKDFLKRISSLTAPIISQTGDVLHSNATSGNQWYNKDVLIAGAVNQDYTPKTSGEYYVVVSTDCGSVSSDKIKFIPTAIESFESNKPNLNVYPNPVTSEVTLKYAGNAKTIEFELLNSIGQVVYKGNIVEEAIVPMFGFLPGVYLVRLKSGEAVNIKKIIKAD
jgi:PKD repeat protein